MMCLFQATETSVTTNEEFRKVLEKKIRIFILLILIGIITSGIAIGAKCLSYENASNDWLITFYSGIGFGLIFASIIKIMRFKQIMANEDLLKKERLKNYDERNRQIAAKAMQTATIIVMIFSYIAMLIGAFYNRVVFYCFWWIVILFTLCYAILFKYFNRKM